jgi:hypothetical protein
MRIRRLFALVLLGVVLSFAAARAQGSWSGALTITVPSMTHGFMNYQELRLNYSCSDAQSRPISGAR